MSRQHQQIDLDAYIHQTRTGPCFLCKIVSHNLEYRHHFIYEDEQVIAFLNKYPTLYGYTLVAPREHRKQATSDFSIEEYLNIQTVVHRVAEAIRQETPTERIYIMSLGSQQANSHVHWHIAALPPGVPYEQQQFEALSIENGVLDISDEEMATLADRLRQRLQSDS